MVSTCIFSVIVSGFLWLDEGDSCPVESLRRFDDGCIVTMDSGRSVKHDRACEALLGGDDE